MPVKEEEEEEKECGNVNIFILYHNLISQWEINEIGLILRIFVRDFCVFFFFIALL